MSYRRSDYAYDLPPERIAARPTAERTAARLLVCGRTTAVVTETTFGELARFLRAGDCLVLNETEVVPARLYGVRHGTGGGLELLLVRRVQPTAGEPSAAGAGGEETTAMDWRRVEPAAAGSGPDEYWEVLCRPGKRLLPGIQFLLEDGALRGEVLHHTGAGRRIVRLSSSDGTSKVSDVVARVGHMPLPPYIDRPDDAADRDDYQTVYARVPGAVAAPTAGLHFTPRLLEALAANGVSIARLVLHVGPGTFKPVTVDDVREHQLDAECFALSAAAAARINQARVAGGRIVAVGTTAVRTLETQARRAATDETVAAGEGEADLFIYPPFEFLAVDAMITNFHLPESTLLMLVAAFAGRERTLGHYRRAVAAGFRFYSYGDAMLIL